MLGFRPDKIRNNDYWYASPLREEKTPSFKVNRKLNVWYDHGIGLGGTIIDFGILYHNCSVAELLQKLRSDFSFHQPVSKKGSLTLIETPPIKIINATPITSSALRTYLKQRCIPVDLASRHCEQVSYELNSQIYTAIGFQNRAGGYELRNQYFKGSSAPKDITFIDNGSTLVSVVEGFFDYLSLLVIHQTEKLPLTNFLVLNSVSLFKKARPELDKHLSVNLFLDRDPAGRKLTEQLKNFTSKYIDQSGMFQGSKDLNEWLVKRSKIQSTVQKNKRHL